MCFFPFNNNDINGIAYKKGVKQFKCGGCPECLAEKSRVWALRACAQAMVQKTCMVTLTYDEYIHDTTTGRILGERIVDLGLSKKHCQDFIKRLREYFHRVKGVDKISYIIAAERGTRTNRPHYHAILFGVEFDDLIKYKKSKRGNWIYKSPTLVKLWQHGEICTVDSINVSAKIARYCTKYCAKDTRGADDTFMLFSRGIGREQLLKMFNGKNYIIDGREYPIPRDIWQAYIENKYNIQGFSRYVGKEQCENHLKKIVDKSVDKSAKLSARVLVIDKKYRSLNRSFDEYVTPKRKKIQDCAPARQALYEHYAEIISKCLVDKSRIIAELSYEERKRKQVRFQLARRDNFRIQGQREYRIKVRSFRFVSFDELFRVRVIKYNKPYFKSRFRQGFYSVERLESPFRWSMADLIRYNFARPIIKKKDYLDVILLSRNALTVNNMVLRKSNERSNARRAFYRHCRDNDTVYKYYINYWSRKAEQLEKVRLTVRERILQLDNAKYYGYKVAAIQCLNEREKYYAAGFNSDSATPPPRSNCISQHNRFLYEFAKRTHCKAPFCTCHKTANDRPRFTRRQLELGKPRELTKNDPWFAVQTSIFN